MKIKYIYILYIISILLISILYYNKYIVAQKQLLTKNVIFDIIEDVESIVISCITRSGNRSISEENKIDFTINYIINNRKKYYSDIIEEESLTYYNKEENILFGKIKEEVVAKVINEYFSFCNYPIKEYKFYKNDFIELRMEPLENISWDTKEYIKIQEKENLYYIYVKYTRNLNDIKNDFYVEYIFDISDEIKIKNVTIYDSIIS